ncbi:hypothetical protein GGQ85_000745 [Nitrobacter vulgaris]|nr:hypothetical protein [Nitrobacter vulgaris]
MKRRKRLVRIVGRDGITRQYLVREDGSRLLIFTRGK